MKKTIQLTILLVFTSTIFFAQRNHIKVGDKYFKNLSYVEAAKEYKDHASKDASPYLLSRLGDCYYYMANLKEANKWYEKLFKKENNQSSEYIYRYAQTLKAVGNYEESDIWMLKFTEAEPNDIRAKDYIENKEKLKSLLKENPNYTIKNIKSINTKDSDFGTTLYNGKLLYSSTEVSKRYIKRTHTWNNEKFLDIFSIDVNNLEKEYEKTEFSKEINSIYHESSVAFSPDGETIYFTRNNYSNGNFKEDKKGKNRLKIYSAKRDKNKWKNIKELPFCNDEYSVGHPTITKDGKTMYFASDMPGSIGGTDIFYVAINNDGSFGEVQNLGVNINTEGREMFPYISEDNTLYFSSDGHFGLGGLDVFSIKIIEKSTQEPVNLGMPINSGLDDFAFVIDGYNKNGFFSSNRDGGKGEDDIYSFSVQEIVKPVIIKPCFQLVSGVVKDKKFHKPLPNARLVVTDNEGLVVKDTLANNVGAFSLNLPCNISYKIVASKEYYQPDSDNFITTKEVTLALDLDFDLEIAKEFSYNERDELIIKINPIYFDYNKANIRPDAAKELEVVVKAMQKYPKLEIRGSSHTDARGKASYNERLSVKRAKSTVEYIISKGINPLRITDKGFGESQLTNDCVDNDTHSNRVKCTDTEHQANRRTEFVIVGFNFDASKVKKIKTPEKLNSHKVVYGDTLFSIAKKYNISLKKLKALNNIKGNNIHVGQVLKLE